MICHKQLFYAKVRIIDDHISIPNYEKDDL